MGVFTSPDHYKVPEISSKRSYVSARKLRESVT